MTQVTRQAAEALVERLADKKFSKGVICLYKGVKYTYWGSSGGKNWYVSEDEYLVSVPSNEDDIKANILGHPIMLTDILEKARGVYPRNQLRSFDCVDTTKNAFGIEEHLCCQWGDCGFTNSLQNILAESEWECIICEKTHSIDYMNVNDMNPKEIRMKGAPAKLFEYLDQLFPA